MEESAKQYAESAIRVRYKETDQMGIAHHANYLVWFEIGRTDLCARAGFRYAGIEERGFLLVVSEVACHYRQPLRYDEEATVRTSVSFLGSRAVQFEYVIRGETGAVSATGFTRHVWLDRTTRKPVNAPPMIVAALREYVAGKV